MDMVISWHYKTQVLFGWLRTKNPFSYLGLLVLLALVAYATEALHMHKHIVIARARGVERVAVRDEGGEGGEAEEGAHRPLLPGEGGRTLGQAFMGRGWQSGWKAGARSAVLCVSWAAHTLSLMLMLAAMSFNAGVVLAIALGTAAFHATALPRTLTAC